jgi:uncharacterized LabA/DUF88 family protein
MAYQYNPYPYNNRNSNNDQDQVAIFIDWDNLVISNYADRGSNRPDLEVLIRRAQQYGTVVIARAYAEWNVTADRLEVYKAGIEPIYAPVFHADRDLSGQTTRGKSLADPVMVTDCIDFLHLLPQIGTYVLVTGDKDMVPVVRLARLRGRRVVIIGPDYVANVLQQVSDEFIPYRFLLAQVVTDPYAAYYQQQAQAQGQPYFPGQIPPGFQPQPGFPPQVGQPSPAQPQQTGTDRRGRRLTGNRRGQTGYVQPAPQPYARITPPPAGTQPVPPQVPPYGYYGQPAAPVPPVYPQPEQFQPPVAAPYGYQAQPSYQPAPVQSQPVVPAVQPQPVPVQPTYQQPVQPIYQQPVQPTYQPPVPVVSPVQPVAVAPVTTAPVAPPELVSAEAVIPAPSSGGGKTGTSDFSEVKDAIQAILAHRTSSGRSQMRARDLKEELLRRIPNFSERRYGFSKFKALLNAAETAGVLQIDQSGHILWVSAPGTPKMQFGTAGSEDTAQTTDNDFEEDGEEEATSPAAEAELAGQDDAGAVAAPGALAAGQTSLTVEPKEAATYAIPAGDEEIQIKLDEPQVEVLIPEERTTSLVPSAATEARLETPLRTEVNRTENVLGPRPSQLTQPFYENVIVLIDHLRTRNRWLGYELLLSNVRDLLSREMPESEAKIKAGNILSGLLSDSIIKMAIEVHSRGARKMTVKVAHLQEEHPAVRYALENQKLQAAAQATAEQEAAEQVEPQQSVSVETQTNLQEVEMEAAEAVQAETPSGEGEAPQWGSHFTQQARPAWDNSPAGDEQEGATEAQPQTEAPVIEGGGEAGELGTEAAQVTPEEMPEPAIEAQPPVESEGQYEAQSYTEGETHGEVTGQAVEAPVVEAPGISPDAGENVQGEPDQAPQGEEPAPAGGYINTFELEGEASSNQAETPQEFVAGQVFEEQTQGDTLHYEGQPEAGDYSQPEGQAQFEGDNQPSQEEGQPQFDGQPVQIEDGYQSQDEGQQPQAENGGQPEGQQSFEANQPESYQPESYQPESYQPESYQPNDNGREDHQDQPDDEGKQAAAETLQPVLELDSDEVEEGDEVEIHDGEEEVEADNLAPKPVRRPRRRRAPRAVAPSEGPGESLGQPAERRVRLNHHQRPHRRPFSH